MIISGPKSCSVVERTRCKVVAMWAEFHIPDRRQMTFVATDVGPGL